MQKHPHLLTHTGIGFVVALFSLNGLIGALARRAPIPIMRTALVSLSGFAERCYAALPINRYARFVTLLHWIVWFIAAFFLLVGLAALRQRRLAVLVAGTTGWLIGIFIITWITYVLWVMICLLRGLAALHERLSEFGRILFSSPLKYCFAVFAIILVGGSVVALASSVTRPSRAQVLKAVAGIVVGSIVVWIIVGPGSGPMLLLGQLWTTTLLPALAAIVKFIIVLGTVVIGAAIAAIVMFIVGRQFVEQFPSACLGGYDL